MSKKKACQQSKSNKSQLKKRHKWKTSVMVGLILCFGLSGLVLAQWSAIRRAGSANALLTSSAPQPTPTPAPLTLSKEYIYAGGRLIATEEPVTSSSSSRVNVALAANGGVATASTTLSGYAPSGANNGDTRGLNWSTSGGWADNTANTFPDWLQIQFNGPKTIDEIDVFTLQDNYANPGIPNEAMTFTTYGITSFDVQYWNGSVWVNVTGGGVSGNNFVWKKLTFTPLTTERIRVSVNNSAGGYSCITEVEAYGVAAAAATNVALSTNGGVATASSEYAGGGYVAGNAINGEKAGANWGTSGGWNDVAPANTFPDWLQVQFDGTKVIHEIDLYTVQDNYTNPSTPDASMTFTTYGLTAYKVQSWNGASWVDIPNVSVTGNYKVWNKFTFSPVTTTKIRVLTSASADGYSRITELEAWGYDATPSETNVALAANGGTASASSEISGYAAVNANNGEKLGNTWGTTGGWNDAGPANTLPDWLQIDFSSQKTIHRIELFMVQDSYWAPLTPTTAITFTYYGLTNFQVQYWTGSAWTDVTGGNVTNNDKVWRTFTFPDITTSKIRVLVTGSPDGWSRLTELEAWSN